MSTAKHIYLFDIDGTLVDTQGAGSRAFLAAVKNVLGVELQWPGHAFAGQTDAGLFRRALAEAQPCDHATTLPALYETYHNALACKMQEQPARFLPGAIALLDRLGTTAGVELALLTGNTRRGSELKLGEQFNRFTFGIYGDSSAERSDLGRSARLWAENEYGASVALTVIGDTPQDIRCARAAGAYAVAVATGHFSAAELAGADRIFADFTSWI